MTKRQERELFFKAVFITEFIESNQEAEERVVYFLETEGLSEFSESFLLRTKKLLSNLSEIDNIINMLAERWKTSRIAKVDLAILRLAIFEINYEGLQKNIAINEAVELAKLYGEDNSYRFINGILAKVGN